MAEQRGHPFYLQNRKKLLAEHRTMAEAGRVFAAQRYGEAFANALVHESLGEFEALIPELPYIGGKRNPLTGNLVSSVGALAVYRVMQRHGKPLEQTGELLYRLMETWIRRYPQFVRYLMGRYYLSRLSQRQSRRQAALSQQRRYPADWVRIHVDGDGQAFEWGVDYLECGIVKFLRNQGVDDLRALGGSAVHRVGHQSPVAGLVEPVAAAVAALVGDARRDWSSVVGLSGPSPLGTQLHS